MGDNVGPQAAGSSPGTVGAPEAAGLRRVLLNAVALLFAYIVPRLATFAAVVVAARVVGVARFGAYGTAAALAVILSVAATLGMMQMLVRDLAQAPASAPRRLAAANVAKAGTGLLMLAALAVLAGLVLRYPSDVVAAAMLLGVSYAIGAFAENFGAYFQSVERMGVWMQAQAVFGIVTGAVGIALVVATRSIVWFCAAPAVGQLAGLGWLLLRAPVPLRGAWKAPWADVRRLLRSLLPFALAFITLTAYYKVDILLVERWRGAGEAGLYAAAYKFVDIAQALALVLATALYPRLARAARPTGPGTRHDTDPERPMSPAATTRVLELLLLGTVPAAGLLWLFRDPVIGVLFGTDYAASAPVLALLAPALPFLALNVVGTFVLAAVRRMGAVAALYAGGLAVDVALNALLVPSFGAVGAGLAMLVAEAGLAVGMLVAVRRHAAARLGGPAATAAAVAVGGALLVAWAPVGAAAGAAIYVAAIALLYWRIGAVTAVELELLRRAIQP